MGNREDLLAGALRCLKEKGWARTTVRDIAAAAGVNHAAIGYHFGSREDLLMAAFVQAMDEWGDEIGRAVAAVVDPTSSPREQYEAMWEATIESYKGSRQLWMASIEAGVQAEYSPKVRALLAGGVREGRMGFAAALSGVPEDSLDDETERTYGGVQMALMSGMVMQWMFDPDHAPSGKNVADGIMALAARIGADSPPST